MASLVFITRTWEGLGGLQRFSRDLWEGWHERYGDRAELVALEERGMIRGAVFALTAIRKGISAANAGKRVHLGDASLSPIAWIIKRFASAPISANACGLDLIYPPAWYQLLLRKTWNSIDTFCCNSEATADLLRSMGWKGRIVVIPCGVTPVPPRVEAPLALRLVLLGRLVPRKGTAWFVGEVMPLLKASLPELTCEIVGRGPEESAIRQAISDRGLTDTVTLAGAVSETRKDEHLRAASLLVVPNVRRAGDMEGFGIVCIEASVRGVPVVAARLEGLQDAVLDGSTGRFFTHGDAADCAAVIKRTLHESWDSASVHRATVGRFSLERILSLYQDGIFA